MTYLNPSTRTLNHPWRPAEDPLWLLTPDELSEIPRDGTVSVASITGEQIVVHSDDEPDTDTRSFRSPDGEVFTLTAWGVRESECSPAPADSE